MSLNTRSVKLRSSIRELKLSETVRQFRFSNSVILSSSRAVRRATLHVRLIVGNTMAKISGSKARRNRIVCVVFDDGWKSQLDALPVLDQYGFKATFGIIAGYVNNPLHNKYMNWQEIHNLRSQGHDIESHTLSHKCLEKLTETELRKEIMGSREIFQEQGIDTRILIYPLGIGGKNNRIRQALIEAGYLAARTTIPSKFNLSSGDFLAVGAFEINRETTIKGFSKYLGGTGNSTVAILVYHRMGPEGVAISQFKTQMAYLCKHNFKVKTMKQVLLEFCEKKQYSQRNSIN